MKQLKKLALGLLALAYLTGAAIAEESSPKVRFNQLPSWLQSDAREAFPDMRHKGEIRKVLDGQVYVWKRHGYSPVLFQQKNGDAYYITGFEGTDASKNPWTKLGFIPSEDATMTQALRKAFYDKAFDDPNFGFQYNNPKKGETVLLYSAIDCGFCVRLEKALNKAGVPFIAVPSTLQLKPTRELKQVYCTTDKAAAWKKMMLSRKYDAHNNERCEMPFTEFSLLGDVMGLDTTPSGLTPDGTVLNATELWQAYGIPKP